MTLPLEQEALVEEAALGLLNDDRTRNGWPAVDSLSHLRHEDAEAYRGSARAIIPLIYTAGHRAGIEEAAALMERTVSKSAATAIRSISEQEKSRG